MEIVPLFSIAFVVCVPRCGCQYTKPFQPVFIKPDSVLDLARLFNVWACQLCRWIKFRSDFESVRLSEVVCFPETGSRKLLFVCMRTANGQWSPFHHFHTPLRPLYQYEFIHFDSVLMVRDKTLSSIQIPNFKSVVSG